MHFHHSLHCMSTRPKGINPTDTLRDTSSQLAWLGAQPRQTDRLVEDDKDSMKKGFFLFRDGTVGGAATASADLSPTQNVACLFEVLPTQLRANAWVTIKDRSQFQVVDNSVDS